MGKIILYHGTPDQEVEPTFGKGDRNESIFRSVFR